MKAVGNDQIAIIVPVLQQAPILSLFLTSLCKSLPTGTQLVLVDDGCGADAREILGEVESRFAGDLEILIIRHDTPKGDGASCNEALRHVSRDIAVRLESDAIVEGDWLKRLCEPLRDEKVAAASGVLVYPQTGGINHAGLTFYDNVGRHTYLNARPDVLPADPFPVQTMTFGFAAFRVDALRAVGGFDEYYHHSYDDLDLALSLRRSCGQILVAPQARAYHWEMSSGPHRAAIRKRNLAIFWSRWAGTILDDLWHYLRGPLCSALARSEDPSAPIVAVDLHSDRVAARRFWDEAKTQCALELDDYLDLAHRPGGDGNIALPLVLGADGVTQGRRYLFLVDNFVRLRGNHYFLERRAEVRPDDLIVDFHGNVLAAQQLLPSAWPGEKVR